MSKNTTHINIKQYIIRMNLLYSYSLGVFLLFMLVLEGISIGLFSQIRKRRENRERKALLIKKLIRKPKENQDVIRLVDGSSDHEGRVEIFHTGRWGGICDDDWDERDAFVVCRQLGYYDEEFSMQISEVKAVHNGRFGESREAFWMDNVACRGNETMLADCRHDGWGVHDCSNSESAGVICKKNENPHVVTTKSPPIKKNLTQIGEVKVKIEGGRRDFEGRVEIKMKDADWGLLCGDGWSLLEASVVCRQLGLGFAQAAPRTNFFGGNRSQIVLSGIKCYGNESSLSDCSYTEETPLCPDSGQNFASVVCTEELPDLIPDATELQHSVYLEDKQLYFLQCSMEENCLSSSAYTYRDQNSYGWHLETRRLLRFTARIFNQGNSDFRPFIPKELWQFHACHMHYHSMEAFAIFDLLDHNGEKVAEGHKASFCLEDNECSPQKEKFYACANYGDQGISVGCADVYRSNIDCQWIDLTDTLPGQYTLKMLINPHMKVAEQDFTNNAVTCDLHYAESAVLVTNCKVTSM